jgi:hypothetical protein
MDLAPRDVVPVPAEVEALAWKASMCELAGRGMAWEEPNHSDYHRDESQLESCVVTTTVPRPGASRKRRRSTDLQGHRTRIFLSVLPPFEMDHSTATGLHPQLRRRLVNAPARSRLVPVARDPWVDCS